MEKSIGLGTGTGIWLLGMYIEEVYMTPELAQELLGKYNTHNRDMNNIHVNYLATQMTSGLWVEKSGLAIKFDENMRMVDGQQRLQGIIVSGVPQNLLAISNVDEKAFEILDTQRTRTAADSFKIKGYPYHVQLAAITKRYMVLLRDSLDFHKSSKKYKITPSLQLVEYESNKEHWDDILLKGLKLNSAFNTLTTTDYCGFMSFLIRNRGQSVEKVLAFFNQFATLEHCEYQAIDEARRRLVNIRNSNRNRRNKKTGITDEIKTSHISTAWNAYNSNIKDLEGVRFDTLNFFM
ncbi:hypothetical protein [Dysgonomonas sp. 25]|uniref:hypothetical protein n=1 Tax=Dysgonomonas sp. 25 TaxID=2302933 RepID=UPI0013D5EB87|nr:hypothetical protein [Dysgonomonas sp. 25]NDV68557.1 hypothetical protein [Dysgonomonas sp. 25]